MSPKKFNIYAEKLINKALEKARGIVLGGERITTIKYADDQAVLAETEGELQCMMESIVRVGKEFGVNINVGKTKVWRVSKNEASVNISLEGKAVLERVRSFK